MSIWKRILDELDCYFRRNRIILNNPTQKAVPDSVNVNWHSFERNGIQNLGDYLSPLIVEKCADYWGVDTTHKVRGTRHIYAVGSILAHGYQNATVWGSGLLNGNTKKAKLSLHLQKLDVRAVRGPLTREVLIKNGQQCPEVYGDPAVLMPMFYQPAAVDKKYKVSVIIHHTHDGSQYDPCRRTHYQYFDDRLCALY